MVLCRFVLLAYRVVPSHALQFLGHRFWSHLQLPPSRFPLYVLLFGPKVGPILEIHYEPSNSAHLLVGSANEARGLKVVSFPVPGANRVGRLKIFAVHGNIRLLYFQLYDYTLYTCTHRTEDSFAAMSYRSAP